MGRVPDRVMDIDGFMADVVVSSQDKERPVLPELFHVILEIGQPLHLERLAFIPRCAGRVVDADNAQSSEIGADKAAFVVVGRDAHAFFYPVRFLAA